MSESPTFDIFPEEMCVNSYPVFSQMKSNSQALGADVQFDDLSKTLPLQIVSQPNLTPTSGSHRENWGESNMADASADTSTDDTDDKNQRAERGESSDRSKDKANQKTLRRQAQNREAARKSRLRKKAYVQQLESSRLKLTQLEQELQRARQQGIFISSTGDQAHSMSRNVEMSSKQDIRRMLREANCPNVPASLVVAAPIAVASPVTASLTSCANSGAPPSPKRARVAETKSTVTVGGAKSKPAFQTSMATRTETSSERDLHKGKGPASPSPDSSERRPTSHSDTTLVMTDLQMPGIIDRNLLPVDLKERFAHHSAMALVKHVKGWAVSFAAVMKYLETEVLPDASKEEVEKVRASFEAKLKKAEEVRVEQAREAKQSLKAANDRVSELTRSLGQKGKELTDLQAEMAKVRESLRLSNERAEKAEKALAEKQGEVDAQLLELKSAHSALQSETAAKEHNANLVKQTAEQIWESTLEQFHLGYPELDLSWMVIDGYVENGALLQEVEEGKILKLPFPGSGL